MCGGAFVTDMERRAREVIDRLEGRPGLFYEILRVVAAEYEVVGPWVRETGGWARRDPRGELIAGVTPSPSDVAWDWEVRDGPGGVEAESEDAKAAADRVLRESGCLLG